MLLLLVFALLTGMALGQAGTSAVRGVVVDQQKSVIPAAKVTLTSVSTGAVRTQVTGQTGNFNFDLIPPGDYRLEVSAPKFKTAVQTVHALIAKPTELEIPMEIGAASETVEVLATNTVQVNTTDSNLGNNFVTTQITNLPLEAKNVVALLTLQPGVTKDGYVAGARSDQSNITLDGVNINDAQTNSVGDPVLRLNSEAVEEFRVNTMTANASAARSSGAQIALVTKSGSNAFHGSFFDYDRNTAFEANDWFNNHATDANGNWDPVKRPALLRDTFGGSVGGPIKKDKFFFFYSYEGMRDRSASAAGPSQVVLPSLAQGNVRYNQCTWTVDANGNDVCNPNGTIGTFTPADMLATFPDTGGVDPAALVGLTVGTKYPANDTSIGDGLNTSGFRFNAPQKGYYNNHIARLDYNLASNQTVFTRLNVIYDHTANGDPRFPDTKQPTIWSHPWGIAASHIWTINNNLVNSFTYGLTREAYSTVGDLKGNDIWFRLVFDATLGTRDFNRITPVHSFVDDISWVKGNHTIHYGVNLTLLTNTRDSYNQAWDSAYTNPSGYATNELYNAVNAYLKATYGIGVAKGDQSNFENAVTALIGRFTNYTARFTFDSKGSLLPSGAPSHRDFATQGYEGYFSDTWKMSNSLTLSYGLRYSLWRPTYEKNGYETQPNIPLGEYFRRRIAGMNAGEPYTDLITVNKSGPANGGPPMYNWDKKVFLPKVAVAWSPHSENSMLAKLFGKNGESVFRGGFSLSNDYFGPAIATFFDGNNTLGFSSQQVISVNTYNAGCGQWEVLANYKNNPALCSSSPGPLFTSYSQDVRSMPGITPPTSLTFPQQMPAVRKPQSIQASLDSQLTTPKNYSWSATYERQLPRGAMITFSYLGRMARNLLVQRDVMTPANLRDPSSGMTWYQAATILEKARQAGTPLSYFETHPIPYFENLFARLNLPTSQGGADWGYANATTAVYDDAYTYFQNDWTTTQLDIDRWSSVGTPVPTGSTSYTHAFYQPQYGALASWSTVGMSNYHAFAASFRERMKDLTLDFNYTWSHSLDDASGLQSNGSWSDSALVLNPFQQHDAYASSDFDMRHIINVNSVWSLPIGRSKMLAGGAHGVAQALIGGWQLSNIFRWNTGGPFGAPYDAATWVTNWQVQSYTTPRGPISRTGCATRDVQVVAPQFFGNCQLSAYQNFRPGYPGDTGARNYFRWPGYAGLDFGLGKTWTMPYREGHTLQFRWEVFNALNYQPFGSLDWSRSGWGIQPGDPGVPADPSSNFSNFTDIQGTPRVMQFGLVYRF